MKDLINEAVRMQRLAGILSEQQYTKLTEAPAAPKSTAAKPAAPKSTAAKPAAPKPAADSTALKALSMNPTKTLDPKSLRSTLSKIDTTGLSNTGAAYIADVVQTLIAIDKQGTAAGKPPKWSSVSTAVSKVYQDTTGSTLGVPSRQTPTQGKPGTPPPSKPSTPPPPPPRKPGTPPPPPPRKPGTTPPPPPRKPGTTPPPPPRKPGTPPPPPPPPTQGKPSTPPPAKKGIVSKVRDFFNKGK
jgi:hypothetical protein